MKKSKMLFMLILLIFCVTFFHGYPKTYKNNIYNDVKMASSTTSVKITYKPGSGSGSNYSTTVTPTTKNYANNVAVLIKNNGVTNYTHSDVTKSINGVSKSYQMILTGWKLVSVVQNGTTISTFEEPEHYNYADRTNAKKDIGTVYAEEGYYYVPDGVTEVTFEAVYGWAIYVKDPYTKMVYDTNYWFNTDASIASGRTGSADSNFGTNDSTDVVASIRRAYEIFGLSNELSNNYSYYDHVIVLLSNTYDVRATEGSAPSTCHTDTYDGKTISQCNGTNSNWGYTTKDIATTITSNPKGTTRYNIYTKAQTWGYNIYGDIRFDFVNWAAVPAVSGGISKANAQLYEAKGSYYNKFETTERFTNSYNVYFRHYAAVDYARILGGAFSFAYSANNMSGRYDVSYFKYLIFGGNATSFTFANTGISEINATTGYIVNPPTLNILGGTISNIYLSGGAQNSTVEFTRDDATVYMYATGGLVSGNVYGVGGSSLSGSAHLELDNMTIQGTFYAGGANVKSKTTGNVETIIKNCVLNDIYGGPQYGDILGKSSLKLNNNTISGNVYGGGYGDTSSASARMASQGGIAVNTVKNYLSSVDHCSGDGMTCYDSSNNVVPNTKLISGQYRYYPKSQMAEDLVNNKASDYLGFNGSTSTIRTRNYITISIEQTSVTHYWYQITSGLSAATVHDSEVTIENCSIDKNVYAGGNRGSINGDSKLVIKDSTVKGTVYGGGYTVTENSVTIYHKQYSFENRPYSYLKSGVVTNYGGNTTSYVNGVSTGTNLYDNFLWKDYNYLLIYINTFTK